MQFFSNISEHRSPFLGNRVNIFTKQKCSTEQSLGKTVLAYPAGFSSNVKDTAVCLHENVGLIEMETVYYYKKNI